jgi:hypothetical protein
VRGEEAMAWVAAVGDSKIARVARREDWDVFVVSYWFILVRVFGFGSYIERVELP